MRSRCIQSEKHIIEEHIVGTYSKSQHYWRLFEKWGMIGYTRLHETPLPNPSDLEHTLRNGHLRARSTLMPKPLSAPHARQTSPVSRSAHSYPCPATQPRPRLLSSLAVCSRPLNLTRARHSHAGHAGVSVAPYFGCPLAAVAGLAGAAGFGVRGLHYGDALCLSGRDGCGLCAAVSCTVSSGAGDTQVTFSCEGGGSRLLARGSCVVSGCSVG